MAKNFKELSEPQILALAISNEEIDGRIYADFAARLKDNYPATAEVFKEMEAEEDTHRRRLIDEFRRRFGEHIPLIRREDVKGFISRKPVWLIQTLGIAAEGYWSHEYIQHSAHILPGRKGLFDLVKNSPATLKYENQLILANGDFLMLRRRYSGIGPGIPNWIVVDIARVENGVIAEHWDVIQDEATRASSKSGLPMFGDRFTA